MWFVMLLFKLRKKGRMMLVEEKCLNAQDVLDRYWGKSIPVDVMKICSKLGIDVRVTNLDIVEKKCKNDISGLIYVSNNEKVIYVNMKDILTRQRFTIAHELAHYFLHSVDKEENGYIISFRGLRSKKETEADRFAARLLMPEDLLRQRYNSIPFPTIPYLSKLFDVSATAMRYRLNELGLSYIG